MGECADDTVDRVPEYYGDMGWWESCGDGALEQVRRNVAAKKRMRERTEQERKA